MTDRASSRLAIRRPGPAAVAAGVLLVLLIARLLFPVSDSDLSVVESAVVARVIDGDTVELEDQTRVRLLAVDAPEMGFETGKPEPHALAATDWLQQELSGQRVNLRYGPRQTDAYGRRLAWIYDGKQQLINEQLLRLGHARLVTDFGLPDELSAELHQAAAEAEASGRGLWSAKRSK